MYIALSILLALTIGTGFVAEQALPGNPLYSVKTGVNEQVRGAFAMSTEAKARWNAEQARRRLDEMSKLAAEGALSAETAAEEKASFNESMSSAAEYAADLRAEGKADTAANIESELNVLFRDAVAVNASASVDANAEVNLGL